VVDQIHHLETIKSIDEITRLLLKVGR